MNYAATAAPRAASTHRQRLLDGMVHCLERQGYEATTIADIASAARVSKRTFYEHFTSKQDCLLALYHRGALACRDRMRDAALATPPQQDRVEAALRAMFEHFALHPSRTKAVLLGVMALGEQGLKLRKQGQKELIVLLTEHAGVSIEDLPPMFMDGMLGIVSEWTLSAFANGTEEDLPHRAAHAAMLIRAGLEVVQSQQWNLATSQRAPNIDSLDSATTDQKLTEQPPMQR